MPDFNQMQRRRLAAKRQAMPDGGFPIRNISDLKNAIQAYGRAKNKPAVKAWIKKRARELGATNLLPDNWRDDILVHYGVKGMKWGVRRTPEELGHVRINTKRTMKYTIDDAMLDTDPDKHLTNLRYSGGYITKGTKLYRITDTQNEGKGRKYFSFIPNDKEYYENEFSGPRDWIKYIHPENKTGEQFQDEYTTTKKMKVAGSYQLIKTFGEEMTSSWGNEPISTARERFSKGSSLNPNQQYRVTEEQAAAEKRLIDKYGNVSYKEMLKNIRLKDFDDFQTATGAGAKTYSLNKNSGIQDRILNKLKSQGYDAVLDQEDTAWGVVYPIVVFDDSEVAKKTNQRRMN